MPHTVLVVDDEDLVREAYRAFFARRTDFVLAGEAADGAAAVGAFRRLGPDVVLMDLQMPGTSGIEATREICEADPEACVIALTTFDAREFVLPALRAGAAGYLLKASGAAELIAGMNAALAGEMPLSPTVRRALVAEVADGVERAADAPPLSPRESETLLLLAQGLWNGEIAARMHVSEGSVKQYRSHVGHKLAARSRAQILLRAIQLGLVDPRDAAPPDVSRSDP